MIHYKKMTKAEAKAFLDGVDKLSDAAFNELVEKWKVFNVSDYDSEYDNIRTSVIDTYKRYVDGNNYELDIRIGLCLYSLLKKSTGFNTVIANDDDIWRYISCKVFPDITHMRYPPGKKDVSEGHRLNTKRFYAHPRRIWLKTLWWYVELSWQGTEEATYNVLKHFGTDTISDLYERPGKGYRLPLYRELMKKYATIENKSSDLFNEIQKRNLVNCRTIEPALTENAEEGYVKRLFEELSL